MVNFSCNYFWRGEDTRLGGWTKEEWEAVLVCLCFFFKFFAFWSRTPVSKKKKYTRLILTYESPDFAWFFLFGFP